MAEELHQVVAARQRHFGMPGSTLTMRKPAAWVKPFAETSGELGRVELGTHYAGMRTGRDSMPRTKLE